MPLLLGAVVLQLTALAFLPGISSIVSAFESRYHHASALSATFLQRYIENGSTVRADAGEVFFRRPGRMRWQYESPEKNLFLVDGKWAWFYVPTDHTATRVAAKRSADWRTPVALLADDPHLSKFCSQIALSATVRPESSGNAVLFCLMRGAKPGKDQETGKSSSGSSTEARAVAQGDAVFLEVQPETGLLARVLVSQPGGISIEFKFANWQFNPPLPESLFHFAPEPGTAIVNGELPSGENPANP